MQFMKNKFFSLFACFAFFAVTFLASAQSWLDCSCQGSGPRPLTFTGAGVTNVGLAGPTASSNVVWYCTSASGDVPCFQTLTVKGDITANDINIYISTNSAPITNALGASGTNLQLNATGFASNDVVVIRYVAADRYQRCVVTNWNGSNLFIHPGLALDAAVGDYVYKMSPNGALLYSASNTTNYMGGGGPLFYGRQGYPTLIDLYYSNTASFKLISGSYYNPRTVPAGFTR